MRRLTVAITVDERMGIAFNNRRQSRDKALIEDLCRSTKKEIYVSPYSAPLFNDFNDRIIIINDPIVNCPDDGFCFIELTDISSHIGDISELLIYNWNRHYPSDVKANIDVNAASFIISEQYEFIGSSHELITKSIFKRINCK